MENIKDDLWKHLGKHIYSEIDKHIDIQISFTLWSQIRNELDYHLTNNMRNLFFSNLKQPI